MNRTLPLESVLKRDRLLVAAGLAGLTALAWGYMVHEARAMGNTGVCACLAEGDTCGATAFLTLGGPVPADSDAPARTRFSPGQTACRPAGGP